MSEETNREETLQRQIKHLEFIQTTITRMGQNSFQMKNWTVVSLSALVALYVGSCEISYLLLSLYAVGIFWLLDGYYLCQERMFRNLYKAVVDDISNNKFDIVPFSMDTHERFCICEWLSACFSITISFMYIPILFVLALFIKFNI